MKSKKATTSRPELQLERTFSEAELEGFAHELAKKVETDDRVILEGPLGAGKSTLTRALLKALGVRQSFEGSPTFPIAHEYQAGDRAITHMDLYRIHSLEEAEDSGLVDAIWSAENIVIVEWLSQVPELEREVLSAGAPGRIWKIDLAFIDEQPERRLLRWWRI